MAQKEFILQGFTTRTHGDAIRELFEIPDIERVILSVAFVSESGVQQIETQLRMHAAQVTVLAGIRNDITSYQGLVRLHGIIGNRLYTIDTGARSIIFHPKLYLVCGKARARLVVGSANLTLGGLNNNIEAGMLLDFDLTDAADKAIVDNIESKLAVLPTDYPSHVVKVGAVAELHEMLASSRLVDEMAVAPPRPTTSAGGGGGSDTIPRITLKVAPLTRVFTMAATLPTSKLATKVTPLSAADTAYESVWRSKPLSRRSLTIPTGKNSNPTGSTTLGKGLLSDIDPVKYFRRTIFGRLKWEDYTNKAGHKAQRVNAQFDLILKGQLIGRFSLTLRHSLTRAAAASQDKNVPTELSWNDARQFIARDDLLGRIMTLYRDKKDPKRFAIEID